METRLPKLPPQGLSDIVRRLGPLSVLAGIAMVFPALGGFALLAYREPVAQWLATHPGLGLTYFILGFALLAGLALLPTYAQAILAGYAFHFAAGFPAALAGFTGAAVLGFAIARTIGGDRALRLVQEHPKWKAVHESLLGRGWLRTLGLITLMRLPTNSPFALTNLALGGGVPWTAYVLGTVVGMAPRTAAAVYIGAQLKSLDDPAAPTWYFWAGLAISLVVLVIIGHLMNRALQRVGGWHTTPASAAIAVKKSARAAADPPAEPLSMAPGGLPRPDPEPGKRSAAGPLEPDESAGPAHPHPPARGPRRRIEGAGVLLLAPALYGGTALLTGRTHSPNVAYFDHLADAFLHGRLFLDPVPGEYDLAPYQGRWYVPFPPLPALLLTPLVAWRGVAGVSTVWFSIGCGAITVWLVWKLLDTLGRRGLITRSRGAQRWLVALFALGCVHWHVALEGSVWFLAQTCTTLFLALAAWLAAASRSAWPCGVALGVAMLGRPHVLLTWPLLYGLRWTQPPGDAAGVSRRPAGRRGAWSAVSLLPAVLSLLALAWYNEARFGGLLDFGYTRQKVDASLLYALHAVGQFSLRHVPHNLWIILLGPPNWRAAEWFPRPDDHGMSLLLTTPALFALAWVRRRDALAWGAWLAVGLTLVPLLLYYNTGWRQFGYRFSLDFMTPLMVLLALAAAPRMSWRYKGAILLSVLVNAWGVVWWYTDWMDHWS